MEILNLNSVWVASLGWSLLHFLWQGAAIAGIAAVLLLMVGRVRSHVRYLINCLALCLCPIWFGFELFSQLQMRGQSHAVGIVVTGQSQMSSAAQVDASWNALNALQIWCSANLSTIVFIWCCAVFLLGIRMLIGWCWLRSFQTNQRGKLDPVWQTKVDALALRLQIARKVGLRLVDSLQSPVTMGMLKPFILLPTCLVSGMPASMIEALLVHELAHIRRHDYAINFIQNLIELILFYHPAVWWLSKNIRTEREYIADEIASQVLAQPRQLALALKELEAFQFHTSQLSIAAHGGHLMSRISRLVKPEVKSSNWKAALLVVGLGAVCFTAAAHNDVAQVVGEVTQKAVATKKMESPHIPLASASVAPLVSDEIKLETSIDKSVEKPSKSFVDAPVSDSSRLVDNVVSLEEGREVDQQSKVIESKVTNEKPNEYLEIHSARIDFTQEACKPEYPKNSVRNQESGKTTLKVFVNKEGGIDKVAYVESSGFRALDRAVFEKLMDPACKARPGKLNGNFVDSAINVDYQWVLH